MKPTNPLLLIDFYKATHHDQYPKDMTKLVSYFTPRMSRLNNDNKLIMFALQSFIKTYLVDYFNENFFNRPLDEVYLEYKRVLDHTLGKKTYDLTKVKTLHDLGYLPLEIKAIPEGERVPVKVPMIEISNTHPDFAWLVNTIESLMSAELWHPMICANVGYKYRQIVNRFYETTVENHIPRSRALGDFSFRGQECLQSAIKSSGAFCLSFLNTATVPTILWLEDNYNCDCTREDVAYGSISTEHSVMCSNTSVDGNETDFVERLLNELYSDNSFSMVSDSYDYWNMIDNVLPSLKTDILRHNGTLLVRGDSGDPIEIVTETVFRLWETFGGYENHKGYKVLDSHIKVIYGDSITPERCEKIYQILKDHKFACNNVALGVGSFSMQCVEEDGELKPFTRDTYGIAVKSTYAEFKNGTSIEIFKNPKTDTGNFKKSQKGKCMVVRDMDKGMICVDQQENTNVPWNLLTTVFKDGKHLKQYTLNEIRQRLHRGKF